MSEGAYTTATFSPPITYDVPDGWDNAEDLSAIFLLLPPGGELEGVDEDTSDFIGIYRGIAAAAKDCVEEPQPGVKRSAAALAV